MNKDKETQQTSVVQSQKESETPLAMHNKTKLFVEPTAFITTIIALTVRFHVYT